MSKVSLRGAGVALVTPFKRDKSVDFDALGKLVDYQIQGGIDYLVALGTTAETPTLSKKERVDVVRFIVDRSCGKVPVVIGMGGNNTADLIENVKTSDFDGVSAILSVTPYYNKPTQDGLFGHYCALSEVSPLPIVLYNVPSRTGVNLAAETSLRIARACPNVIAVKEASGNIDQIRAIISDAPEGFCVISGDDAITTDVILSGGIGVISVFGNAFPKETAWLVKNALQGNAESARLKMEADFGALFSLMFVDGNPAGVKCLLNLQGRIENELRLPLVSVREATREKIKEELTKLLERGVLRV